MAWWRADDDYPSHPKILRAGPLGMALHVRSGCWSSHYLTDGFIPASAVSALVVGFSAYAPKTPGEWAEHMVACGLWDLADGGFCVHDFNAYNPTKREVLRARKNTVQQRIEAGRARARTGKRSGGRYISPTKEPAETPADGPAATPAEPPAIHQPRTPSPSPETKPLPTLAAPGESAKKSARSNGGGHPAVSGYCDAWAGRYGKNPDIASKDAVALARLWKKQGPEEYAARLERYLLDDDPFLVKVAHPAAQFESRWNALGVKDTKPGVPAGNPSRNNSGPRYPDWDKGFAEIDKKKGVS